MQTSCKKTLKKNDLSHSCRLAFQVSQSVGAHFDSRSDSGQKFLRIQFEKTLVAILIQREKPNLQTSVQKVPLLHFRLVDPSS
jgi:uncharacterized protein (DUF736 family)